MSHSTATIPYDQRKSSHPLTEYLLRLMVLKQSNLCLSADVDDADYLLDLADALGPKIVVLKTHYDIIKGWKHDPRTGMGARLGALARKHGFLIFEDRKFGDIGSTVQKQFVAGDAQIIEWAHIINVNMVPGPPIVHALSEAAAAWREKKNYEVKTDISVGTPRPESIDPEDSVFTDVHSQTPKTADSGDGSLDTGRSSSEGRKASIVSITTVSQHFESASQSSSRRAYIDEDAELFPGIEEAPLERGLLILAQMSSAGNLMNKEYTQACVETARKNKGFVMGYIAQESLNTQAEDQFLTMTPGCQLPPVGEDEDAKVKGDGKGQQYNTPKKLVGGLGCDIIIVGRGIIKAHDPAAEAERYRKKAWEAYEERIQQ
jgi:uridine monophosphate synthetase